MDSRQKSGIIHAIIAGIWIGMGMINFQKASGIAGAMFFVGLMDMYRAWLIYSGKAFQKKRRDDELDNNDR